MRCSFDGLSARVRQHLDEDPLSGYWFAFINRRQTQIKVLAFEDGGYCVWSKRLEEGQFAARGPAGASISEIDILPLSPQIGTGVDQRFSPMAVNICSVWRFMFSCIWACIWATAFCDCSM